VNASRIDRLREQITVALQPTTLEIEDESHRHAGHAGAKSGMGHFRVKIVSGLFEGLRPLQRHRLVYDAVAGLMKTDVHALSIDARTPDEDGTASP
jgi:BolA protein